MINMVKAVVFLDKGRIEIVEKKSQMSARIVSWYVSPPQSFTAGLGALVSHEYKLTTLLRPTICSSINAMVYSKLRLSFN